MWICFTLPIGFYFYKVRSLIPWTFVKLLGNPYQSFLGGVLKVDVSDILLGLLQLFRPLVVTSSLVEHLSVLDVLGPSIRKYVLLAHVPVMSPIFSCDGYLN